MDVAATAHPDTPHDAPPDRLGFEWLTDSIRRLRCTFVTADLVRDKLDRCPFTRWDLGKIAAHLSDNPSLIDTEGRQRLNESLARHWATFLRTTTWKDTDMHHDPETLVLSMANDVETRIEGDKVQAAVPTHGGKCPMCRTRSTRPSWNVSSAASQCPGCGEVGAGWLVTNVRTIPVWKQDQASFIRAVQAEAVILREQWIAQERSSIRTALAALLIEAIEAKPASPYAKGRKDWEDWYANYGVDDPGGILPISYDPRSDIILASACDPADHGDRVEVTVDDLNADK